MIFFSRTIKLIDINVRHSFFLGGGGGSFQCGIDYGNDDFSRELFRAAQRHDFVGMFFGNVQGRSKNVAHDAGRKTLLRNRAVIFEMNYQRIPTNSTPRNSNKTNQSDAH